MDIFLWDGNVFTGLRQARIAKGLSNPSGPRAAPTRLAGNPNTYVSNEKTAKRALLLPAPGQGIRRASGQPGKWALIWTAAGAMLAGGDGRLRAIIGRVGAIPDGWCFFAQGGKGDPEDTSHGRFPPAEPNQARGPIWFGRKTPLAGGPFADRRGRLIYFRGEPGATGRHARTLAGPTFGGSSKGRQTRVAWSRPPRWRGSSGHGRYDLESHFAGPHAPGEGAPALGGPHHRRIIRPPSRARRNHPRVAA